MEGEMHMLINSSHAWPRGLSTTTESIVQVWNVFSGPGLCRLEILIKIRGCIQVAVVSWAELAMDTLVPLLGCVGPRWTEGSGHWDPYPPDSTCQQWSLTALVSSASKLATLPAHGPWWRT